MIVARLLAVRWTMAVAGLLSGAGTGLAGEPPAVKTLDALLQTYKSYELPFPPADARLVLAELDHQHYALVFRARDPKTGEARPVFAGTGTPWVALQSLVEVEPTPNALRAVDTYLGVELALQCHARGWTELASKVLEEASADRTHPPEAQLARSAWDYWLEEFRKPATNRAKVARVLKAALKDQPDEFTIRERSILDALELSLVPGTGKPGTVGALVDGLIEVTTTDRFDSLPQDVDELHPAYVKLARQGFDAVPDLIAHLNDERLTRAVGDDHYTVADVVRDLLQSLAGQEVSSEWQRSHEGRVDQGDVEAWWADARKAGEEAYLTGHVFGLPANDNVSNRMVLDVLAHKYPKRLPELYRRMLKDRPGMLGWELGSAVAGSALPRETKRELFLEATRCTGPAIRIDGIWRLWDIDRTKGTECLIAELATLPETPADDYWKCPETRLVYLVAHVNEPGVWGALEKAVRRVDVGFRMEFLRDLLWNDPPAVVRTAHLRFRSKFLEDATVRDTSFSAKYDGPVAGDSFPQLEVRNFVARQLAWELGVDAAPTVEWTAAQWAQLRDDVKKALRREGIR
jgi:hypothetical protein